MKFMNRRINKHLKEKVNELERVKLNKRLSLYKLYQKLSELISKEAKLGKYAIDNPEIDALITEILTISDKYDMMEQRIKDKIRIYQESIGVSVYNSGVQEAKVAVRR